MSSNLGFLIEGAVTQERRLVDWWAAFGGYAGCDERANVESEAYLSAFTFGEEFRHHLDLTGSTKGYEGPCSVNILWLDIDRDNDLDAATRDARRLCAAMVERYSIDGDTLLIFFSGSKGFHIGLPSSLWQPQQSADCHKFARQFAGSLAASAEVTIDTSVYDRVRAFRAPNSCHPKTGLHKRRLEFEELLHLKTAAIVERAAKPEPFELPDCPPANQEAIADWQTAVEWVAKEMAALRERRSTATTNGSLNRLTMQFIRSGATEGDRHRLLFSAAANLAEFDCPLRLAHALLTESGRDSGLSPSDVRRQIDCGLAHVTRNAGDARNVA